MFILKKSAALYFIIILMGCATTENIKRNNFHSIPVPSTNLFIEFPSDQLKLEEKDLKIPWYIFSDNKGLTVSFNFDKASKCGSSENCRDYLSAKLKSLYPDRINWKHSEIGIFYFVENLDLGPSGFPIRQFHMNANYVVGKVWVDIHLSKVFYNEEDRSNLVDFFNSVRFVNKD